MEKTEKSTLELELDLNQKWEWSRCQEDGVTLESVFGSGFSGLINIGSSCYINSVRERPALHRFETPRTISGAANAAARSKVCRRLQTAVENHRLRAATRRLP